MMNAFEINIKDEARENDDFRRVLFTSSHAQLVVMAIQPDEEIGEEVHTVDQIFYVVKGEAEAVIDGKAGALDKGEMLIVPAGTYHNIRNTEDDALKLLTIYAPPQHPAGTIHRTKADASPAERTLASTAADLS